MTHPLRMRLFATRTDRTPVAIAVAAALTLIAALVLPAAASADTVPGQVLVRYTAGTSIADRADVRDETGTSTIEGLGMARAQLLQIEDGDSVAATVRQLEADPTVADAEPNDLSYPALLPNDPSFYPNQWGLYNDGQTVAGVTGTPGADIDAPAAWNTVTGGLGTVVAVMDTGANLTHPDLANELWVNPSEIDNGVDDGDPGTYVDDVNGYDFVGDSYDGTSGSISPDSDPTDVTGHGTHVSGIALAQGNNSVGTTGVSMRAALMSLRICGAFDTGCPNSALIQAINYAADHGARVANGSVAGSGSSPLVTQALQSHPGTLYVFAAGNGDSNGNGVNDDTTPNYPCTADQGGGYSANNVICVAATDQFDRRASFSNYGASSVDLGAPGVNIYSTSSRQNVFSDDFESGDISANWTNIGSGTWAASTEPVHNGSYGITDSPGGNYAASTTNEVISNPVTLAPLGAGEVRTCELDYFRDIDLGAGDTFTISVLLDGNPVSGASVAPANHTSRNGFFPLPDDFDAGGQVQVALTLTSNASGPGDGVHMDDVDLHCHGTPSSNGYEFMDGTSMATPMVTGAAALLFSDDPASTASGVKTALLAGVDKLPDLAGSTVSGGRLNVYGALAADSGGSTPAGGGSSGSGSGTTPTTPTAGSSVSKPNTFFKRRPGKVVKTTGEKARVVFKFGSTQSGSTFRCQLDSVEYVRCSRKYVRRLLPAKHVLKVRAVNSAGAEDSTPAIFKFRVKQVAPQP